MTPPEKESPEPVSAYLPKSASSLPATLPNSGENGGDQPQESYPRSPDFASPLNADNLIRAFRYRWPRALAVGLVLGSAAAASVWFLLPSKYTAYVLLRVASEEQRILPENRGGLDSNRYQNTQVALIKSRPIILAALRKQPELLELGLLKEQSDPAGWLEDELKATILENTELVRASLTGNNPKEVKVLLNAIKDAYLQEGVNNERKQKLDLLQEIDNALRTCEENIYNERENLSNLAASAKTADPQALTVRQKFALEEYAQAKKDWALVKAQVRNAAVTQVVQKAKLKAPGEMIIPEGLIELYVDTEPPVKEKIEQLKKREDRIAELKSFLAPGPTSRLAMAEKDRDAARHELERTRAEQRDVVAERLRQKMRVDLTVQAAQSEDQLNILRQQEELLQKEVERLGQEAERIGAISFRLELKRAEIEQADLMIKRLREEKERLRIEMQSSMGKQRVTVLHEAEEPGTRDLKTPIRIAIFAGAGAMLLGMFGVTYLESRARRINTTDEVEADLGMRVIGVLPDLQNHASLVQTDRVGTQALVRRSALLESIDGIRAMLFCDRAVASNRLLMVTSALAREGKSTLAAHLALSIARAGMRCLLVDCDLRRPALHQIFGIVQAPGLSEVLLDQLDTSQSIQRVPVGDLSILPVGRQPFKAIQVLAKDGVRKIFEKLRQEYDFIIVDSAPVLPVGDSLLLGKQMDCALLSVRPHVSQIPSVFAAYERLRATHVRVLGIVFNGVRKHFNAYQHEYLAQSQGGTDEGFAEFEENPAGS